MYLMNCGDCVVLCDDYIALALKLNFQLMLMTIDHPCMSLCFMSLQAGLPGGGQVSADEQQI